MTKLEKRLLAILIIGVISVGIYLGNNYLNSEKLKASQLGYQSGIYFLASQQTQTGNIYYLQNVSGNWSIASKNIKDICGAGK